MNKDRIAGAADQAKGAIKEAAGKLTGDEKLKVEGALDKANSDQKTKSEFFVKFYQKGGAGENEIGTTLSLDDVKARMKGLPEAVKNHPFPYFIEVATYDTVPLPTPPKVQLDLDRKSVV